MHTLFNDLAKDLNPEVRFDIILEPKNQGRMGRPDWRIQDSSSLGVYGYIEGKGPSSEPFDVESYKNQINRYLSLGHKLIITDGIDFIFCFNGTPAVVPLIDKGSMNAADWSRLQVNPQFRFYMEQFYSNPAPQKIDEEKLIELVAIRTRNLADEILEYADLTFDEAIDDGERNVIALLDGLKKACIQSQRSGVTQQRRFFGLYRASSYVLPSVCSPSKMCNRRFTCGKGG